MKTNRINTAPRELTGEISQAFNLHGEEALDGWAAQNALERLTQDRQQASKDQFDMFPDSEGFAPGSHGPGF